jgi:predicted dehydrogenase
MPYLFPIELMGNRATLRQELLQSLDGSLSLETLAAANPIREVQLEAASDVLGRPAIRVNTVMPGSADVTHHPFQDEIDELVACILEERNTSIDVFDAQKTMEVCLAADRSAELGGQPVKLPFVERRTPGEWKSGRVILPDLPDSL